MSDPKIETYCRIEAQGSYGPDEVAYQDCVATVTSEEAEETAPLVTEEVATVTDTYEGESIEDYCWRTNQGTSPRYYLTCVEQGNRDEQFPSVDRPEPLPPQEFCEQLVGASHPAGVQNCIQREEERADESPPEPQTRDEYCHMVSSGHPVREFNCIREGR